MRRKNYGWLLEQPFLCGRRATQRARNLYWRTDAAAGVSVERLLGLGGTGLLGQKNGLDVGQYTTLGDGDTG